MGAPARQDQARVVWNLFEGFWAAELTRAASSDTEKPPSLWNALMLTTGKLKFASAFVLSLIQAATSFGPIMILEVTRGSATLIF